HALAGVELQVDAVERAMGAVVLAGAFQGDLYGAHRAALMAPAAGRAGGCISGALSMTPPGSSAGNCDCAQRTMETAGLLSRMRAAGARQRIWSTTSLGR